MRIITSLFLSIVISSASKATTPTWAKDVAPILYSKCTACHHPGGAGHGSLITYDDALSLSGAIQYQVSAGYMPPWPPERSYRHFADERFLSNYQKQAILDWVSAGAPSGDTTLAPAKPVYTNSAFITTPDFTATIPTYAVTSNSDIYQCFVLPSGLSANEFITSMEIIPGNTEIVHHVLVYQDTTGVARQKDIADPNPGYTNFGGIGVANPILIGGWVPGQRPYSYPSTMGVRLYKNSDIVLQIHYPKNSLGKVDSTKINLKLSTNTGLRNIMVQPLLNHTTSGPGSMINGPLVIPANTVKTFTSKFNNTYPIDFSLLSIAPHMHLIGKSMICYAVGPTNDTIPLINIKDWNFEWQGFYTFQRLIRIPSGYKAYATAVYDNTVNNPRNPNKSNPVQVKVGEATTDEMMLCYFNFLIAEPGDENFIVDSTDYAKLDTLQGPTDTTATGINVSGIVSTAQLYELYPNPTTSVINARFYLPVNSKVSMAIYDLNGKLIAEEKERSYNGGFNEFNVDVKAYAKGEYILQLKNEKTIRRQSFIVN